MPKYALVFATTLVLSFLFTPLAKMIAVKVGAIDVPKDNRRMHKKPIPLLGGLAIYMAFMVTGLIYRVFTPEVYGVMIGAGAIVASGIYDDIKPMPAKLKLLIQIIAACIVVSGGTKITYVTNPISFLVGNHYIVLGIFSVPITIIWIVGVTNALNLIDGLDGLAAGVASISAMTLFAVSVITMPYMAHLALMTLMLAGAAAGFLPFNFNPAKIFMGDTGALFLGFMLATISVMGVFKSAAILSILVPVFAIGFPIFDTLFAMLRRFLNGRPIMEADKGHLHHRLMAKGLSQRQTVLILYGISIFLGVVAIAIAKAKLKIAMLLVLVVFLLLFLGVRYFGLMDSQKNNEVNLKS